MQPKRIRWNERGWLSYRDSKPVMAVTLPKLKFMDSAKVIEFKNRIITLTKHGHDVDRPGQGSASSDKSNSAALSFRAGQDATRLRAHSVEHIHGRAGLGQFKVAESYAKGESQVVIKLGASGRSGKYDLVFFSIPSGPKELELIREGCSLDFDLGGVESHGHQRCVIGVTDLVKGPEGVIPSLVCVERRKKRHDLRRQVTASSFYNIREVGSVVADGKISVLRRGVSRKDRRGVSDLIECGPDRFDGFGGIVRTDFWNGLTKSELVNLKSVRVWLDHMSVGFLFEEDISPLLKPRDMVICARESRLRATKRVSFSHGENVHS